MLVTLDGIVTLVRPLQSQKAWPLMYVTLDGIVTLVRPLQPSKADTPISVTLDGIVTLFRLLQPSKAEPPISVTSDGTEYAPERPAGNATSNVLLFLNTTPFTSQYSELDASTKMSVRLLQ